MTEHEDMILPDDFEADLPLSDEVTEQVEETVETEAQPQATEETVEETPQQQLVKVKFNREEKEIPLEEAIEYAQMGMNYPKLQERYQALESDPRLHFVEELAQENNMTVSEYLDAVRQQKEQSRIQQLVEQGISEEVAQELLEGRRDREERKKEKEEQAKKQKQDADYMAFFDYFKQANGRDFDSNKDQIPESVWQATQNGVPLKYAFMEHQNQQLQQQLQTLKQNEVNAQRTPVGSTTVHGGTEVASEDPFLQGFNSIQ